MTKYFELRDRATFIPVAAVLMRSTNWREHVLIRAAGYDPEYDSVVLVRLDTCQAAGDPYAWNSRTMTNAHLHIVKEFESLCTGDVVDVEFVLGEVDAPKESQAHRMV